MPEPVEMATASRMQDMEQIRKKNTYVATKQFILFFYVFVTFMAFGVESPRGGAVWVDWVGGVDWF